MTGNLSKNIAIAFLAMIVLGTPAAAKPVLTPGTWVEITPPGIGDKSNLYSMLGQGIAVAPSNPSIIYWCNGTYQPDTLNTITRLHDGGIYKTTDGGSTWVRLPSTSPDCPIHVRIDPNNSEHVYCSDGVRGAYCGFWVTTNGGNTWTQPAGFKTMVDSLSGIGQANFWDGYCIDVDPTDFNHVLYSSHSGSPVVGESFNGGNSWTYHITSAASGTGGYDVFFLYDPALGIGNTQTWIFCTQGDGFWRTTNSGTTWTKVSTYNMQHGGDQIFYSKTGVLYMGATPFPLRSTDNGASWQQMTSALPNYNGYFSVVGDGQNLYTAPGWQSGPLFTSPEISGITWTAVSGHTFATGPYESAFDKVNNIMYMSCWSDGVWALKINQGVGVDRKSLGSSYAKPFVASEKATLTTGKLTRSVAQQAFTLKGEALSAYGMRNGSLVKIVRSAVHAQ